MKRIGHILPSILFISFLTVGIALAQTDVQGSKDHPLITRMPDYYISQYNVSEFAGFDPTVIGGKDVHWEGKVYSYGYSREEDGRPIEYAADRAKLRNGDQAGWRKDPRRRWKADGSRDQEGRRLDRGLYGSVQRGQGLQSNDSRVADDEAGGSRRR